MMWLAGTKKTFDVILDLCKLSALKCNGLQKGRREFGLPAKGRPAKNLYTQSERLTAI